MEVDGVYKLPTASCDVRVQLRGSYVKSINMSALRHGMTMMISRNVTILAGIITVGYNYCPSIHSLSSDVPHTHLSPNVSVQFHVKEATTDREQRHLSVTSVQITMGIRSPANVTSSAIYCPAWCRRLLWDVL